MIPRTEHPRRPDEDQRDASTLRRAVLGGAAGVALLVGPVLLANVVVPDDAGAVEATTGSETSLVAQRRTAASVDLARATAVQSLRTTTTLPPTTTTTVPPTTTTTTAPPTTTTTEPPPTTEAAAPEPGPAGRDDGGAVGDPNSYATWDALAECESGGNWALNTGNGYYGGLQFSAETWRSVGGSGLPHQHPRETQIHFGQVLQSRSGWGQWPHCAAELGLG
ncbi:MAG TPA: transglycosylase family protein [Acidimicrobiales bacterium]|nr:transglycosylase family protein [Acidimicrobiales bacterium]